MKVGVSVLGPRRSKPHDPTVVSFESIPTCDRQRGGQQKINICATETEETKFSW